MASFLRGKQAGMQKDLSADILPHLFAPDEQIRYGINSQIRYTRPFLGGAVLELLGSQKLTWISG